MTSFHWVSIALLAAMNACGGGRGSLQEDINSLRSFGLSIAPLVSTPSVAGKSVNKVAATFYAAVPLHQTATLVPYVDNGNAGGAILLQANQIHIVANSAKYVNYNGYRLFGAQLELEVPTVSEFTKARKGPFKSGLVRYGVTVTASGGQHEDVIADFLVYPKGSPQLQWKSPNVNIADPLDSTTVSTAANIALHAKITDAISENTRLGWFVTNGSVDNRHSTQTTWLLKNKGPQTLAVVVHGLTSRGFAIKVIDVNAN